MWTHVDRGELQQKSAETTHPYSASANLQSLDSITLMHHKQITEMHFIVHEYLNFHTTVQLDVTSNVCIIEWTFSQDSRHSVF